MLTIDFLGFHTTTYTAILYASSTLGLAPGKIILIGILVQLSAFISSIFSPRLQEYLGCSNHRLLLALVLAGEVIPVYACLGLILPFGGLRTEGEMYVAAVWFGLVRDGSADQLSPNLTNVSVVRPFQQLFPSSICGAHPAGEM